MSFRIYEVYADAIERAAAKTDRTPSQYIRDLMTEWAYADLGETKPELPDLEKGRYAGVVQKAANELGMSRTDFEKLAALKMAEETFARKSEAPGPTRKQSGPRAITHALPHRKAR